MTATNALTVKVKRPGSDLNLNSGARRVMDLTRGQRTITRELAESPLVDGAVLTGMRRGLAEEVIRVRCSATTSKTPMQVANEIIAAVTRWGYRIEVTVGTTPKETWRCLPADCSVNAAGPLLRAGYVDVTLSIPRQP
jgi:hypothetical protein